MPEVIHWPAASGVPSNKSAGKKEILEVPAEAIAAVSVPAGVLAAAIASATEASAAVLHLAIPVASEEGLAGSTAAQPARAAAGVLPAWVELTGAAEVLAVVVVAPVAAEGGNGS